MICAIIPAAGQGSRMKSSVNKQFIDLCGVPVIVRTLRAFEESPLIDSIVAVTRDSEREELRLLCAKYNIKKLIGIAYGGDTRQDSVRNALEFLANVKTRRRRLFNESINENPKGNSQYDLNTSDSNVDHRIKKTNLNLTAPKESSSDTQCESFDAENCYVLIHDGARPFVSEDIIRRSVDAVRKYSACGIGVPVKDTIKKVSSDLKILKTLPRENLWAIQTPQSFHFPLISKLHEKAFDDRLQFTDDTSLAEHYGESAYMVQGDYQNIKITTPEDLLLGEMILNQIDSQN
jgi:2-C-methyl-D-erythritol 4-phosphate cytidylyltransferase